MLHYIYIYIRFIYSLQVQLFDIYCKKIEKYDTLMGSIGIVNSRPSLIQNE